MKLKAAFGLSTAALLMFAACASDETVNTVNDDAKDKGNITLKVVDYNTQTAIDSTEIYSLIDSKTSLTDTNGIVVWKKNVIGNYSYKLSKEGYATRFANVELAETSGGDVARVEDLFEVVNLHKLGASVKGTVLLQDPQTKNLSAAEKITVVLQYNDPNIAQKEIETTTNSSGVFEFEDIAEGLSYSIIVPQATVKSKTYAASESESYNDLRVGEVKNLEQITMSVVGLNPELINNNLLTIDTVSAIELTYSTQLIEDSVATSWHVYKGSCGTGTPILTSASLKDGKTVVVKPVSGKWTNLAGYCVTGKVYSTEGKETPEPTTRTFIPGSNLSKPNHVKDLATDDYYGRYIQLSWTPSKDYIDGYKVYYKNSKTADYIEYTNWHSEYDGELPIDSSVTKCEGESSYSDCAAWKSSSILAENNTTKNYYWYKLTSDVCESQYASSSYCDQFDIYETYADKSVAKTTITWTKKTVVKHCEAAISDYSTMVYSDICEEYTTYGSYDEYYYVYEEDGETKKTDGNGYYLYDLQWWISETLDNAITCTFEGTSVANALAEDGDCYEAYESVGFNVDYTYKTTYTHTWSKIDPKSVSKCTVKQAKSGALDAVYDSRTGLNFESYESCKQADTYDGRYSDSDAEDLDLDVYNYSYQIKNYTEYASIRPSKSDSLAFVYVNDVDGKDVTSASFIVLPYVNINNNAVTADVATAKSASFKLETEEEK